MYAFIDGREDAPPGAERPEGRPYLLIFGGVKVKQIVRVTVWMREKNVVDFQVVGVDNGGNYVHGHAANVEKADFSASLKELTGLMDEGPTAILRGKAEQKYPDLPF